MLLLPPTSARLCPSTHGSLTCRLQVVGVIAGRRARCLPRSAGSSVKLSVTASALVHKFQRAPDRPTWSAAAARLPSRDHMRTIRATGRSANRDGPLVQPAAVDPIRMGQMQQVALIATHLPMSTIAGEASGMMNELRAGRLACVAQVQ